MSKLMQESLHFSECQQGRFLICWFGEIHHYRDMWTDILSFLGNPLSLIFCHPRTALFSLTGMEVSIEHSKIRAVLVEDLIGFHVGVIYRNVFILLESNAIEFISQPEDTLDNLRQFEIRT